MISPSLFSIVISRYRVLFARLSLKATTCCWTSILGPVCTPCSTSLLQSMPPRTSCGRDLLTDGGATVSRRQRSKRKSNATLFPMVVTLCRRANLRTSFCVLDGEDCDQLAGPPRSAPVRTRFVSDAAGLLAGSIVLTTAGPLVGDG